MKRWCRVLVACLFLAAFPLVASCGNSSPEKVTGGQDAKPSDGVVVPSAAKAKSDWMIIMNDNGFSPTTLRIKKGQSVKWINQGSELRWPASDVHPVHANYPEKGGCIGSKFDACNIVKPGEAYVFTFKVVGAWRYHDHLKPEMSGVIIVTD